MLFRSSLLALVAASSTVSAVYQGFNYGSTQSDGSAKDEATFELEFNAAKSLVGTSGFTSARLYTMIQAGTGVNGVALQPISAIQAAINTQTSLLLGLWASAGQDDINNEIAMLQAAIQQYGKSFTDLVAGVSVGSEDLYRVSPTGILNDSGAGANPQDLITFIGQVRSAIAGTALSGAPVGHVDTWTAWVNGSNFGVADACDFVGMDAYPYFQNTIANSIELGNETFFEAYQNTQDASQGKPVWITETGWPVSGATENLAVASLENAKTYWDQVGCTVFGQINTWWYTLQDAEPVTPSPSFGIVGSVLSNQPLYNLTCPSGSKSPAPSSSGNAASSIAASRSLSAFSESTVSTDSAGVSSIPTPAPGPGLGSSAPPSGAGSSTPTPVPSAPASQPAGTAGVSTHVVTYTVTTCPVSYVTSVSGTVTVSSAVTLSTVIMTKTSPTVVSPSATMQTSAAPAPASSAAPAGSCPTTLTNPYEYPHLIVPVSKSNPSKANGSTYDATFSADISSLFNFDIPASYAGKTCSLVFLLPEQAQLETSSYTVSGSGGIDVGQLASPALQSTTYASCPAVSTDLGGPAGVAAGNSYLIASGACQAGATVGYKVSATGDLSLEYFQDYNPSPIGLYITVC